MKYCILTVIVFVFTAAAATAAFILYRKTFKKLTASFRLSRHFYYSFVFSAGFLLGINKTGAASPFFFEFITGLILINLLFISSLAINHIYDIKIDLLNKKPNTLNLSFIDTGRYFKFYLFTLICTLVLSLLFSPYVFAVTAVIHAASWGYSSPPLRLKKIFPLNTAIIALATLEAMALGFVSSPGSPSLFLFPPSLAAAVVICLSLAFNVKDINDYKGDLRYGINTLMTILGPKKGRQAAAAASFTGYILFPVITSAPSFVPFGAACGALTAFFIVIPRRKINETAVFSVFFVFSAVFILINPAGL